MAKQVICKECGKDIPSKQLFYVMRIEMFAGVGDLVIDDESIAKDHTAEIEHLLSEMEGMDVDEINDQVYESYTFELCPKCRNALHKKLKEKKLTEGK